ncbi:Uncharacterised protein [Acinetobacter baumannii]|nr:Uncharacterised protein [Acinetobacter baumannii]
MLPNSWQCNNKQKRMQLVKLLLNMPRLMLAELLHKKVPIIFLLKSRVVRIRQKDSKLIQKSQ